MEAKFVIGIDLGTTNSVLAYAPLEGDEPQIQLLDVPQIVAAGTVESRTVLPSFTYLAGESEADQGVLDLPWARQRDFAVGEFARSQAAEVPQRSVSAAKSWLAHSRVDRRQPILPWNAPDEGPKISPFTASQRYLEHLAAAWESAFPDAPLAEQHVVLTAPASFDAGARELTHEAALAAGLPDQLVLLEEPQAAVYAWLADRGDRWRKDLQLDDRLLVCDVGGGTTDLTLIEVVGEEGDLILKRLAVGNHLLVGGDNMDLALAHHVAGLFAEKGHKLDPWQSVALWHSCRAAKEKLLSEKGPKKHPISILGRGSKLIGKTVKVDVDRESLAQLLVDGFFPPCELADKPARGRASGFQEIGLPFETDTAITRHLAEFLSLHGDEGPVRPTHVLFNGGVFKAEVLHRRLLEVTASWFGEDAAPRPLKGAGDLDHAVARGAAYYAWSKQRGGLRIRGGAARSYYIGIETAGLAVPGAPRPLRALCVVPQGMEEGTEIDVPFGEIGLVVGQPAQFRFFSSSIRKHDKPGELLPNCNPEELIESDSLEATLPADEAGKEGVKGQSGKGAKEGGKEGAQEGAMEPYVPVRFESRITELGMFELWCVSTKTDQRWKLEFSVRDEDPVD